MKITLKTCALGCALAALTTGARAADDVAEIAKKSMNPISDLMSVPVQYNVDSGMGATGDGEKTVVNIQPVLPFTMNADWNVISRTILPVVDQQGLAPGGVADASGIGDIVQSFFFSPKKPTAGGWILGAGPVLLLPTASDDLLGAQKWGVGPTAVALKQANGFTAGALANHIWSFAGEDARADVNATFLQPFFSYTTKTFTSFTINTESTYDWTSEQWSVPVNLMATQMLKVGGQMLNLQVGVRHWADAPAGGPDDTGYRAAVVFMFPK